MPAISIKFCTHGGGTNWGVPNNLAAIRASGWRDLNPRPLPPQGSVLSFLKVQTS